MQCLWRIIHVEWCHAVNSIMIHLAHLPYIKYNINEMVTVMYWSSWSSIIDPLTVHDQTLDRFLTKQIRSGIEYMPALFSDMYICQHIIHLMARLAVWHRLHEQVYNINKTQVFRNFERVHDATASCGPPALVHWSVLSRLLTVHPDRHRWWGSVTTDREIII